MVTIFCLKIIKRKDQSRDVNLNLKNIKLDLKGFEWESVDWVHMDLVNKVMKIRV
jgi:hypothetical protein